MLDMTGTAKSPIGRLVQRHAEQAIREALQDTRVVLVNGARQSGKSTLLRQVARADAAEWRDLDSPVIRQAALADPAGFVDYRDMMVIKEIQRVPELLLPIKVQVDNDARPGRYLLSGSARVLGLGCPGCDAALRYRASRADEGTHPAAGGAERATSRCQQRGERGRGIAGDGAAVHQPP